METTPDIRVVLVTAPDLEVARQLAGSIVGAGLAACVNLVPGVESHYKWQGKLEVSQEVLLIIKSTDSQLAELERHLLSQHPYDIPEILALPVVAGSQKYLDWVRRSARPR